MVYVAKGAVAEGNAKDGQMMEVEVNTGSFEFVLNKYDPKASLKSGTRAQSDPSRRFCAFEGDDHIDIVSLQTGCRVTTDVQHSLRLQYQLSPGKCHLTPHDRY